MLKNSILVEHDLDSQTLHEIEMLRNLRIDLAKKQLQNIDETLDQLVARGLITVDHRPSARLMLEDELRAKIRRLESKNESMIDDEDLAAYAGLV